MAPPALLLVFSEPGSAVTKEEFADWYDNEHIPLCMQVPVFTGSSRWKATDGEAPTWAALYDLASYADTLQPPYRNLLEVRSERETRILRDVEISEGRIYEQLDAPIPPPSALFDEHKPARFLRIVAIDVKPGSEGLLNRWYDEEHSSALAQLPGWVRSRRFVFKAKGSRSGRQGQTEQPTIPRFLAVHEWDSVDAVLDPAVRESFLTPLRAELDKVLTTIHSRTLEYYKHWERD